MQTDFPLRHIESGDLSLNIITGGEYVLNMKDAQVKSDLAHGKGIRTPLTVAWFKFSHSFAKRQGLPLPDNDNPTDINGENWEAWEKRLKEAGLNTDFEITEKGTNILGQEIRVFRNVFRLLDISETLKNPREADKKTQLSAILKSSREIFEKEFGVKMSNAKFLHFYTNLIAEQVSKLIKEKIIFHSISQFNQNITLAAEIVDWNGVTFVEGEPEPEEKVKIYKQLFTFCGYLKSVSEAVALLDNTEIDDSEVVDSFLKKVREEISNENWQEFKSILLDTENLSDLLQFTISGTPWAQDFEKYQQYADLLAEKVVRAE